jgi:hypothetical protein
MPRTLAAFQRGLPVGVDTPRSVNPLGQPAHGRLRLQVPVEQLRDQRRLARLHPDPGRIPGPLGSSR